MKITALEEYGLRCLVQLARGGGGESLTLPALARLEGISVPYVAKVMRALRQQGLVSSERGQAGGYRLSRRPAEVTIGEVLTRLSEKLYDVGYCQAHSGREERCVHAHGCSIRSVWHDVQSAVDGVLSTVTLEDLARRSTPR
ncbi:RrF2 family transcriptional regulator [Planctomycetota bacterium]